MASLMLVVFLVELAVLIVNSLGAAAISDFLWRIYNLIPSERSGAIAAQRKLQKEYLALRRDLHATSSQDEFAKWARLRRQHDKKLEELEAKSAFSLSAMTRFRMVSVIVRVANGVFPPLHRENSRLGPSLL